MALSGLCGVSVVPTGGFYPPAKIGLAIVVHPVKGENALGELYLSPALDHDVLIEGIRAPRTGFAILVFHIMDVDAQQSFTGLAASFDFVMNEEPLCGFLPDQNCGHRGAA